MSWWQVVPTVLCTVAIVFLPGYVVARSWALTGLVAVGTAAPVSIGLLAGMAVLGPMAGLPWNVLLVVVPAVALALVGLVLRKVTPRALGVRHRESGPLLSRWPLLVHFSALLIPAVLLTRGLIRLIGSPENISQAWDNFFHLNAVRYILDSGSGSSLTLGGMYSDGANPSPYPGAWHDLVSLVVQVSGASIPVAANAVTLVIGALVWPISCIFLTTRVTGMRPVPVLFTGALSAVFGAYPYQILYFGVLYPFFLSLALLPAALALLTMATGVSRHNSTPRWLAALVLTMAAAGIGLAHPSTLLALAVFAVPIFVVAIVRYRRTLRTGQATVVRYWGLIALLISYLAVGTVVWSQVRPSEEASAKGPIQSESQAIGQVLAGGTMKLGPTWIVLLLTLVAVGLALRRQLSIWVLGVYLIAAGFFVVVSATPEGALRNFLTGVWYNDPYRLAAQLPMITVVVCTLAATWLFTRSLPALSNRLPALSQQRFGSTAAPAIAVASGVAIVLGVFGQYSSVNYAVHFGGNVYQNSDMLSSKERALLSRLDEHVSPEATIIGNPWTGTAFAYALSGRRMLTPQLGQDIPPNILYVMENLDEIGTDPQVCSIIRDLNSYYVLDFIGPQYLNNDVTFDGLESLSTNPGLTRIDHEGTTATLYRVTGCPSIPEHD